MEAILGFAGAVFFSIFIGLNLFLSIGFLDRSELTRPALLIILACKYYLFATGCIIYMHRSSLLVGPQGTYFFFITNLYFAGFVACGYLIGARMKHATS